MSKIFLAQYRGICASCDETIYPGDDACFNEDDDVVHRGCQAPTRSPFSKPKTTSSNICPECSLDHAGRCF